jgi:SAM-dependent methyltransferase
MAGPSQPPPTGTGAARDYDAWFESHWGRYAWAVESSLVRTALGAFAGPVLDVGCGTGRSSALLRRSGVTVVGTDPDGGMLGLARPRVDAAVRAEGERLPFDEHAFATSVALTVLEFVPEPAPVLAEMARVTRPSGTILVGVLNPVSAWGLWRRRRLRTGPWRAARFLSRRDLDRLGRPYGTVSLHEALRAPGWLPGLSWWGPAAERWGRALRAPGAFRVMKIERR